MDVLGTIFFGFGPLLPFSCLNKSKDRWEISYAAQKVGKSILNFKSRFKTTIEKKKKKSKKKRSRRSLLLQWDRDKNKKMWKFSRDLYAKIEFQRGENMKIINFLF